MYQALVRIKNGDMTATSKTPEAPRFDWAAVLDDLLPRMRELRDPASQDGGETSRSR